MLQCLDKILISVLLLLTVSASGSAQSSEPRSSESQIRQWASGARASSQYSAPSWAPSQATGPPDTDACGDLPTAWAPAASEGFIFEGPNGPGPEWLALTFNKPVHALKVRVHETNQSGFAFKVELKDSAGNIHTVWQGSDSTGCPGWLEVEFPKTEYLVSGVTLHTAKPDYEEVDAVELIGELQATLSVSEAPPGARVFLDDAPWGVIGADGHFSADAPPGAHRLRVTADGYQDWAQEVTLNEESRRNVEVRLAPKTGDLTVRTKPGQVQVYLDDEFRGTSSSEGRLVLKALKPGSYQLRLSLASFKEWTQTVTLGAGEALQIEAELESAGPKPLALSDVEQALTGGLSKARVAALVKEYGVDFALTDEAEKRLRAAGADETLLLAIAKGRK